MEARGMNARLIADPKGRVFPMLVTEAERALQAGNRKLYAYYSPKAWHDAMRKASARYPAFSDSFER